MGHCGSTSTDRLTPRVALSAATPSTTAPIWRIAAGSVLSLDDDLAALLAAQAEQRRRAERAGQLRMHGRRGPLGGARLLGGADDPDQRREGRIAQRGPAAQLAFQERGRVVPGRERDRRRLGRQRLHEDATASRSAPGTPRELRHEREGALLCPEVGEAQRLVGVDDDAELDVREVVALGDHLRAEQDPAIGALEGGQHDRRIARIAVQAEDRPGQLGLEALGARCRGARSRPIRIQGSATGRARGGRSGGRRAFRSRGAGRASRRRTGTPTHARRSGS